MMLPVLLIVSVLAVPWVPPIVVGAFETEAQCLKASKALDDSTRLLLRLTCEVRT